MENPPDCNKFVFYQLTDQSRLTSFLKTYQTKGWTIRKSYSKPTHFPEHLLEESPPLPPQIISPSGKTWSLQQTSTTLKEKLSFGNHEQKEALEALFLLNLLTQKNLDLEHVTRGTYGLQEQLKQYQTLSWNYFRPQFSAETRIVVPSKDGKYAVWNLEDCFKTLDGELKFGNPQQIEALKVLDYFNLLCNLEGAGYLGLNEESVRTFKPVYKKVRKEKNKQLSLFDNI